MFVTEQSAGDSLRKLNKIDDSMGTAASPDLVFGNMGTTAAPACFHRNRPPAKRTLWRVFNQAKGRTSWPHQYPSSDFALENELAAIFKRPGHLRALEKHYRTCRTRVHH